MPIRIWPAIPRKVSTQQSRSTSEQVAFVRSIAPQLDLLIQQTDTAGLDLLAYTLGLAKIEAELIMKR